MVCFSPRGGLASDRSGPVAWAVARARSGSGWFGERADGRDGAGSLGPGPVNGRAGYGRVRVRARVRKWEPGRPTDRGLWGGPSKSRQRPDLEPTVFELLEEITSARLREEGRVYGGGLYKIEPNELGRIPAAPFLERIPELDVALHPQRLLVLDWRCDESQI